MEPSERRGSDSMPRKRQFSLPLKGSQDSEEEGKTHSGSSSGGSGSGSRFKSLIYMQSPRLSRYKTPSRRSSDEDIKDKEADMAAFHQLVKVTKEKSAERFNAKLDLKLKEFSKNCRIQEVTPVRIEKNIEGRIYNVFTSQLPPDYQLREHTQKSALKFKAKCTSLCQQEVAKKSGIIRDLVARFKLMSESIVLYANNRRSRTNFACQLYDACQTITDLHKDNRENIEGFLDVIKNSKELGNTLLLGIHEDHTIAGETINCLNYWNSREATFSIKEIVEEYYNLHASICAFEGLIFSASDRAFAAYLSKIDPSEARKCYLGDEENTLDCITVKRVNFTLARSTEEKQYFTALVDELHSHALLVLPKESNRSLNVGESTQSSHVLESARSLSLGESFQVPTLVNNFLGDFNLPVLNCFKVPAAWKFVTGKIKRMFPFLSEDPYSFLPLDIDTLEDDTQEVVRNKLGEPLIEGAFSGKTGKPETRIKRYYAICKQSSPQDPENLRVHRNRVLATVRVSFNAKFEGEQASYKLSFPSIRCIQATPDEWKQIKEHLTCYSLDESMNVEVEET